ncbi:MAG: hypothetical protein ACREFE_00730 [Limisphaerales bacterium]
MPFSPARPLSRDRAWACVTANFGLPGIGSLKARRIFSGICQLGFALAGFVFGCAWIVRWCYRIFQAQAGETISPNSIGWLWKWAVICFGVSWLWTLATCISLVRQAKANEEKNRQSVPPKISDLPKHNP